MKTELYSVVHFSQSRFVSTSLRLAKEYARKNNHPIVIRFEIDPCVSECAYKVLDVYVLRRNIGMFVRYSLDEYRTALHDRYIYDF